MKNVFPPQILNRGYGPVESGTALHAEIVTQFLCIYLPHLEGRSVELTFQTGPLCKAGRRPLGSETLSVANRGAAAVLSSLPPREQGRRASKSGGHGLLFDVKSKKRVVDFRIPQLLKSRPQRIPLFVHS